MEKKILQEEKEYLKIVENEIDNLGIKTAENIKQNKEEIEEQKKFFAENFYELKQNYGNELADINTRIENLELNNDRLVKFSSRLKKQKKSPYFGRFDFKTNREKNFKPYYIGIGHIENSEKKKFYVLDWRADISSLYYDDEQGQVSYNCPNGKVNGELSLKRQFKIENGSLKYYIDSNLVIDDNILMEELSRNSTAKMHDIVSTIQKEQNVLIRANELKNLIVQGVAGSGKTSVAMHRVSYLLYKYRDTLKTDDILILSPSELFADYIEDVLPSLGDDKPYTTTFNNISRRLLGENYKTREELLDNLITVGTQKDFENIAIKYSFEFLEDFKNFLNNDICNLFVPKTLVFGNLVIEEKDMRDIYYNKLKNLPIYKRIEAIAEHIVDLFNIPPSKNMAFYERAKKILYSKMITTDPMRIYNIFLRSMELDEIQEIGAYDIAQILLIKENLFGFHHNYDAKYVIIDEMQDYTPCHFYLFDKIWHCPKMFLGDINQSIDKSLSDDYLKLLAKETKSKICYLTKSYRSTLQISRFSQKILGKKVANNVNRSGEEVQFIKARNQIKALEKLIKEKQEKNKSKTLCVICKDRQEIAKLQEESDLLNKFAVLDETTEMNGSKLIMTTILNAKGVEFDIVVIPFANDENYQTELDRNLLYVACTRALHNLYFIADKKPSRFLVKEMDKKTASKK